MGVSARVETVATSDFVCDHCGKEETIAEVVGEAQVERSLGAKPKLPPGWRAIKIEGTDRTFHTRRCGIGFLRALVDAAWADPSRSEVPKRTRRADTEVGPS